MHINKCTCRPMHLYVCIIIVCTVCIIYMYVFISTHIHICVRMHTSTKCLFMTVKGLSITIEASANVSLYTGLLIIVNM